MVTSAARPPLHFQNSILPPPLQECLDETLMLHNMYNLQLCMYSFIMSMTT